MEFLIAFLTVVLVLVAIFLILVVLMQRGNAAGGLGSAMGGGMAESAFGAETSSVLSKTTSRTAIVFFVLVFGLYLGQLWLHEREMEERAGGLPEIEAPEQDATTNALQELMRQSEEAASEAGEGQAAEEETAPEATAEETEQAAEEESPTPAE